MIRINLEKLIKKFGGKWIALNNDSTEIIASSKSAKDVYKQAKKKGYDVPRLFKVPSENLPYIGNAIQI